jgi:hypothetical protein
LHDFRQQRPPKELQYHDEPGNEQVDEQSRMSLQDGYTYAEGRLSNMNMQFSLTQPMTPNDGNCMLHALLDQIQYDPYMADFVSDHHDLRLKLVNHLDVFVSISTIQWPFDYRY